jgi:alkylhydroperoxidase/carboxymuconolactone decarboxylase family protein YurZ
VPKLLIQVGGSISFAPPEGGDKAAWLGYDTRHMLAELNPKPDQVTIAINTVQMNVTELISLAINAACTNLNPDGTRRHIRAALEAGATRDEILFVLKAGSVMAIHSCSLGAPILLEEAQAAGVTPARKTPAATPACDAMRAIGQWNTAWDPFFELDPMWTDEFFATAIPMYKSGVLPPKDVELLSIACDASFTHMYAPGTHRHIKAALKLGATMEEIMEVLKLCVVQGVQACNMGVPILAEEIAKLSNKK